MPEASVLSFSTVKTEERVSQTAKFDYIRSEETIRLIRTGSLNSFKIRFLCADILHNLKPVIRKSKDILQFSGAFSNPMNTSRRNASCPFSTNVRQIPAAEESDTSRSVLKPPANTMIFIILYSLNDLFCSSSFSYLSAAYR